MRRAAVELDEKHSRELTPSAEGEGIAHGPPPPNQHGLPVRLTTTLERFTKREIDEDELLAALRGVGSYAAESRILPEKLIIALKAVWSEVAPWSASAADRMDDRLFARLVTACLDGYYGS
jgi:hypothetical protein